MLLPVQWSPKEKTKLFNGLIVTPHKRMTMARGNGMAYTDTVVISGYESTQELQSWIVFHAFIFNSPRTVNYYEKQLTPEQELKLTDQKMANQIDFTHPFKYIYLGEPSQDGVNNKLSYDDLYRQYSTLDSNDVGLIQNYLNDFTKHLRLDKLISDPSYWQMMVYYSIIEKIIGRPDFCQKKLDCDLCGKIDLLHASISAQDWLKKRLVEIIDDETTADQYAAVIFAVRQKIRHSTVHESLIPSATLYEDTPEGVTIYDLKSSIGSYETDAYAVTSLKEMIKSTSRYLLLDHLFHFNLFPTPQPMRVLHIKHFDGVKVDG